MKPHLCAIFLLVLPPAHAVAAGAFVAAQYDPFVGDWQAASPADPVAQVIRTGDGAYTVNVLAAFDDDAGTPPIAILRGSLPAGANPQKDPVELRGAGADGAAWTAEMWPDCCSAPHLELVNTRTRQTLRLRHYLRPNPLLHAAPPAAATVLFNGQNTAAWTAWPPPGDGAAAWRAPAWRLAQSGSVLESVPGAGAIASRESFGDQRAHLEFRFTGSPASVRVLVQGVYRVTLVENYGRFDLPPSGVIEKTPGADGPLFAENGARPGAGGHGAGNGAGNGAGLQPAARASRAVLEWQSLDIDFRAPRFAADGSGKILAPARATVWLNNVLLYENVELAAPDGARETPRPRETPRGPLVLEERGAPVQFRNVWVR